MNLDLSKQCVDVPKRTSHPCALFNQEQLNPVEEYCKHVLGSLFSPCHSVIDPEVRLEIVTLNN